jgi:hypothetical protein
MDNIYTRLGFDIISNDKFETISKNENNELNKLYNEEKFEVEDVKQHINYDINEIIEKTDDDIIYEKTNKNIEYLEWYLSKNYLEGMLWYIKHHNDIPFIEDLSYFFVKRDLTGKTKLDKYEKVILKKELQKQKRAENIIENERAKYIRKIERERNQPSKTMKYINKKIIVKF